MHIDSFIESFEYKEIGIKRYIQIVVLFLLVLLILIFSIKFNDYYKGNLFIEENNIYIITDLKNLENIKNKNKIIIERTIFTYLLDKIEDINIDNKVYKKINLKIDNLPKDKSLLEYKIIMGKKNIINIIKGED